MILFFSDKELTKFVEDDILFEGYTYYLNIENHSKKLVERWLAEEYILSFITNYHPENRILTIRFDNVIGFVNILGYQYDVRSKKLFDSLSGNNQFQSLLDEITKISNSLTFNFKGTSYGRRKTDYKYNWNDLEVFDYYYQLVFTFGNSNNLQSLLNQCLREPNSSNIEIVESLGIEKSKRVNSSFYTKLGHSSNFGEINDNHSLANSAFAQKTFRKINRRLLPLSVTNTLFLPSINTIENRFLKFFLEEIISICLRIINSSFDAEIKTKAYRLQNRVRHFLLDPFFKNIQRLTFIPNSSSVLLKKSGYKEIYYHFIQSKFSFRPILDDQIRQSHRTGLKNIATLYEIWVFFKIAHQIFDGEIIDETFNGQVLKNGSMIGSYAWQNEKYQLFFNKSYSRGRRESYSLTLRPDVSLLINGELYLFDAKYKFNANNEEENDLLRIVKPEDIHKMHAYLDAIPKALVAIVVYPGNQFVFYNKEIDKGKLTEPTHILDLNGVGAVPLIPNKSDTVLKYLLDMSPK